jgi:hypothetical protein
MSEENIAGDAARGYESPGPGHIYVEPAPGGVKLRMRQIETKVEIACVFTPAQARQLADALLHLARTQGAN